MTGADPTDGAICAGCHATAAFEREIEARVAARLESDAWLWRFRLIAIETGLMTCLVAVAGLLLHQPTPAVLRAALLVGASCLASGMLLLGLSTGTGKLLRRVRRRRTS